MYKRVQLGTKKSQTLRTDIECKFFSRLYTAEIDRAGRRYETTMDVTPFGKYVVVQHNKQLISSLHYVTPSSRVCLIFFSEIKTKKIWSDLSSFYKFFLDTQNYTLFLHPYLKSGSVCMFVSIMTFYYCQPFWIYNFFMFRNFSSRQCFVG